MKLHEGIKQAIALRTASIVHDSQFFNILADFQAYSEYPEGRNIMKLLCGSKYLDCIIRLSDNQHNASSKDVCNEIDRIAYVMSGEFDEEFDLVRYCCESLAYGLGLLDRIDGFYTVDNFKHAAFIGRWDFFYKDSKLIKLEIQRNYKAITSINVEFDWKPVHDDGIELFIEGIICFRGVLANKTIVGKAVRLFDNTEWSWNANKEQSSLSEEFLEYSTWLLHNNIDGLEDSVIQFLPRGNLSNSKYSDRGRWYVEDENLFMSLSSGFLSLRAYYHNKQFVGKGKNPMGNEWDIILTRQ